MIRPTLLTAWLLFALAAAGAPTGTLTYPSRDLLAMDEGTIEFWFQPRYDTRLALPSTAEFNGLLALLSVTARDGGFNLGHFAGAGYQPDAGLYVSIGSQRTELHGFFCGKFVPEQGRWYHAALTWQGRFLRFYLDGQLTGERDSLEPLRLALGTVGDEPLMLGDKWHARGAMAVDDLRLSSVVRQPAELGCHGPLRVDPWTLLLDDFEQPFEPDGTRRTTPAVLASGVGGLPSKGCAFVAGRHGQGLALAP